MVARIDTPVLNQLSITFFMDLVFNVRHFKEFIGRATGLNPSNNATLRFNPWSTQLQLDQPRSLWLEIRSVKIDWQLDSMALVCVQLSPFFSSIERFYLVWDRLYGGPLGGDNMEITQFLEIFRRKSVPAHAEIGMKILGPFLSVEDPDTFFFMRGFPDLASREPMKAKFYEGELWKN